MRRKLFKNGTLKKYVVTDTVRSFKMIHFFLVAQSLYLEAYRIVKTAVDCIMCIATMADEMTVVS